MIVQRSGIWLVVPAFALALLLTACGGSDSDGDGGAPVADASVGQEDASGAGANSEEPESAGDESGEDGAGGKIDTSDVETGCDASFLFAMGQAKLILGPTMGNATLAEEDVKELFAVMDEYESKFSGELAEAYATYEAAALSAVGQDVNTVVDLFAQPEVTEATEVLRRTTSTECGTW